MTAGLRDLAAGAAAIWPVLAFIAVLTAYAVWACWANDRAKKLHRRDAYLYVEINADTSRFDAALRDASRATRRRRDRQSGAQS